MMRSAESGSEPPPGSSPPSGAGRDRVGVRAWVKRRRVALAAGAILLLGLGARWQASRWELPYLAHWDEPFVANRALEILRTGDLNPHFFNYGSLVVYLDAAVDALHYYRLVGLPEDDPRHLRSPQEIRFRGAREDPLVTAPEGEPYWVSHPSFYLWNRRLTALFGAAAIALAFHLARRLAGDAAGLVAAFALATSGFHIEQSALVTTDVPAATLALGAVAAAFAFADGGRPRALVAAGALVGLAAGTKYNAALFGLVPLGVLVAAALRRAPNHRGWLWAALPAATAGGFLLSTPYALLDLPTFLDHSGRMLSGYVEGRGLLFEVAPGWPHLALDLGQLASNWGPAATLAIAAGFALALRRPPGWVVLPIGVLVLIATSATIAPFHRNVVVCYPLAAIALGVCARALLDAGRGRRWLPLAAAGLGLALLLPAAEGLARARALAHTRDTRSLVAERLDDTLARQGLASVALARELAFHGLDLARLRHPVRVAPLRELVCAPAGAPALLAPTRPAATFEEHRPEAERLRRLIDALGEPVAAVAPANPFAVDSPVIGPGLGLFRAAEPFLPPLACAEAGVDLDRLDAVGSVELTPAGLALAPGAGVASPVWRAPPGPALLALRAAAAGASARLAVVVADARDGSELARTLLELRRRDRIHEVAFALTAPAPIRVRLEAGPAASVRIRGLWLAPGPAPDPAGP